MTRRWMPSFLRTPVTAPIRKPEHTARPQLVVLEDRTVPTTFTNPTPILVPAGPDTFGDASPYPSNITVTGMVGVTKTVTVTLHDFSHTGTSDVDVLLVGPSGQGVVILSDTGGPGNAVSNITLTFDDTALDVLGKDPYSTGGTFRPSNVDTGADVWPGFTLTPGNNLNKTFRNTDPNGTWSLRVVDDANNNIGTIAAGWSIDIVSRVNSAPVAVNDSYTVAEDNKLTVSAANGVILGSSGKDVDADGDPLVAELVTGPTSGTLTFNADGSFEYTPFLNFNGTDSFTYRVDDGFVASNIAKVTITITPSDDPAVAIDDRYVVSKNTKLSVSAFTGVLSNDLHPDNAPRSTILFEDFESFTLKAYQSPTEVKTVSGLDWTDALPVGWVGKAVRENTSTPLVEDPVEFRGWRIHNIDSWIQTEGDQGRINFTLGGVGKAGRIIVADGDAYDDGPDSVGAGRYQFILNTRPIDLRGVLENSAKLEFDSSFFPEAAQVGTVRVSYDGGATFSDVYLLDTPTSGGSNNPSKINEHPVLNLNNPAGKESAIVQFDYIAGNNWWWAFDNLMITGERTSRTGLTAAKVTNPTNGTLSLAADGSFTYLPNTGFVGKDSFTYTVSDGTTTSAPATVTLEVRDAAGNNLPVANPDNYSTAINKTLTIISNAGVLANDTDADGDNLTVTLVGKPSKGSVTLNADGSFTFTPGLNASGTDTFTYTANDVFGASTVQTVTISILGNPPTITSNGGGDTAAISILENNTAPTLITTVTAVDPDPGSTITYSIVGGADKAQFSINPTTGELNFNTKANFEIPADTDANNTYIVIVQATDDVGSFDKQTITLTITDDTSEFEIFSDGGGATASVKVTENTLGVTTVRAVPAGTTYSIVGGADKNFFNINATTGVLSFKAAPDFETPLDAGLNNVYDVTIKATSGVNSATQDIAVTVIDFLDTGARNDSYTTDKGKSLSVSAPGVLANDSTRITLFSEGFEGVRLVPFRTGNYVGTGDGTDFAPELPVGWTKVTQTKGGMPLTEANPPQEYRGFNAIDIDSWQSNQGQLRNSFTLGGVGKRGTILIADGDTYANADGAGIGNPNYTCDFTVNLPQISLAGAADNTARIEFDSSFRPEAAQAGKIEYSLDGGPFTTLLVLDNAYCGGGGGILTKVNEHLSFDIPNVGNSTLDIRLNYVSGNDWWWAIDNVLVTAERPGAGTPAAQLVSGPSNGTLVSGLAPDGSFTYQPNPSFFGIDKFTYKVSDGAGFTNIATVTIDVQNTAPVVTDFTINNGDPQRSRIITMKVNLASPVDLAQFQVPGAVTLTRLAATQTGGIAGFVVNNSNGLVVSPASGIGTSFTITFDNVLNNGVENASLADGRWQLAIAPAGYTSNDATPGQAIRRLYGDIDANQTVDGTDFGFFGTSFGGPSVAFDYDNNGTIDGIDFGQFGARGGVTI